jgi:hypothetical protein
MRRAIFGKLYWTSLVPPEQMVRYTHLKGVYFFLVVWGVINPGYRQVAVRVLCPQILVGPGAFRTFSIFSALSFCSLGRGTKKKKGETALQQISGSGSSNAQASDAFVL